MAHLNMLQVNVPRIVPVHPWFVLPPSSKLRYLRGQLQAVPCEGVSDRRAREAHFELFLRARQTALALWCDFFGMQCALTSNSVNGMGTAQKWPDNKEGGVPCFLWCSGSWRYATAGWTEHREEEQLQVVAGIFTEQTRTAICLRSLFDLWRRLCRQSNNISSTRIRPAGPLKYTLQS